jgi:hypothetical protein
MHPYQQLLVPLEDKNKSKISNGTENVCNLIENNDGVRNFLYNKYLKL